MTTIETTETHVTETTVYEKFVGPFAVRVCGKNQVVCSGLNAFALSAKEYRLFSVLAENFGMPTSREELRTAAWPNVPLSSNVVDVYIGYLRKKLPIVEILPIRNIGYMMKIKK